MKCGIYTVDLRPSSVAQAAFQRAVLDGLECRAISRHQFIVLCPFVPNDWVAIHGISYVELARESKWAGRLVRLKQVVGSCLLAALRIWGVSGGRSVLLLSRWANPEPCYFRQLRELGLRVIWNMNQHELISPIPSIRTIWDLNHRIHSAYPEFSYARYGFDGCDANMANSLARATYIITGTNEGKQQVSQMFGVYPGKIRVIPFPTPRLILSGNCTLQFPKPYVFYPARFWPHKNHVVILQALRTLKERSGTTLNCVFAGPDDGNLSYILRYADDLGIREQVHYVGRVPDEDLSHWYSNAFALIYASAVGPDNLPPLEGMSVGCPVITADVPGAREQYGDAALFFSPLVETALADQLGALLNEQGLREQMIEKGYRRAKAFTVEDYATKIIELLDEFVLTARAWEKNDAQFT